MSPKEDRHGSVKNFWPSNRSLHSIYGKWKFEIQSIFLFLYLIIIYREELPTREEEVRSRKNWFGKSENIIVSQRLQEKTEKG